MAAYSIRTKILTIVLVFIVLGSIAFVIYSISTTMNYRRLRLEGIEKTVAFETEKVNKIISELEQGAIFYALGGRLVYNAQSEELGLTFVSEFLSSLPAAVGAGFSFKPYEFKEDQLYAEFYAFRDRETGKVRLDSTLVMDNYNYHNAGWYLEIINYVKEPNQVVWTRPYADDSGSLSLMTTAGAPIFNEEGRLIGISTIDWEIDSVIEELTAVKPTENSFVLLGVPERDYVISSTRTRSVIGANMQSIPWDITADKFQLDGITYFRFSRYMDNGWFISVQIPENEIFAEMELQNIRFILLTTISLILMLTLAFLLIAKFINTPIKQLTAGVSQLALGNLDTKIEISSMDELGLLAKVFNNMTGNLKKSIEENVREHSEKERISTELSVAATIQNSMLPRVFPPFPQKKEFDLYASMVPAKEVGGDFYDFFLVDNDNLAVVVADVSGKGVGAALFMVIAKTLIDSNSSCKSPKQVFEIVNKKLIDNNETGIFVTAFMGFYNIPTGRFIYASAGHNPPLIKRKNKYFEFLEIEPCFVLAWMEDAQYTEHEITLESGDVIYLYTDGVTEAMNQQGELFSEQRLAEILNKNRDVSPKKLLRAVKTEIDNFCDGAKQTDDITMLALQITEDREEAGIVEFSFPESDNPAKELNVEAKLENFVKVMDFIDSELERFGYPLTLKNEINIAVEEIFINIADYAYEPASGNVNISISVTDKAIIKFEDTGKPYNPLEQKNPDLEKSPEEREIGGLGIFLVRNLMDTVEYTRFDGRNILVMTKNFPEA